MPQFIRSLFSVLVGHCVPMRIENKKRIVDCGIIRVATQYVIPTLYQLLRFNHFSNLSWNSLANSLILLFLDRKLVTKTSGTNFYLNQRNREMKWVKISEKLCYGIDAIEQRSQAEFFGIYFGRLVSSIYLIIKKLSYNFKKYNILKIIFCDSLDPLRFPESPLFY